MIDKTPSSGLWWFAADYYKAAVVTFDVKRCRLSSETVPCYLVCHSIELVLKAFLRAKGLRVQTLINKFGHDLESTLTEAKKQDLDRFCMVSSEFCEHLRRANFHYKSKDFEYIVVGIMHLPSLDILLNGTKALLEGTKEFCLANHGLHDGKPSAYAPS